MELIKNFHFDQGTYYDDFIEQPQQKLNKLEQFIINLQQFWFKFRKNPQIKPIVIDLNTVLFCLSNCKLLMRTEKRERSTDQYAFN